MAQSVAPIQAKPRAAAGGKWAIAIAVALGALLEVVDVSIVNVALTDMQNTLGATLAEVSWVVSGYAVANVIVLPMLIGMSIDSGVHLVHRHRTDEEEDVLGTSTARAVFYAALTTMLSFGSLAFAPHRGIASIGELLTIGVGLVLIAYVVVLPAVLEWDDRRRRRKRD